MFPYLSPQRLIAHFEPLGEHLAAAANRRASIVTAPDYGSFNRRTLAGDYDIVLTPPHFGRVAERDGRYQRIAVTRYEVRGVFVVRIDSPVQQLAGLKGKFVATPPRDAVTTMLALELLRSYGLEPGRDVALREFDTVQNSMAAPLRGDADAGVTGFLVWSKEGDTSRLRALAETPSVPGLMMMASPRLAAATVARLRNAAYAFGDTTAGRTYFAATGHGAWLPIDDAAMRSLDRYTRYAED